MEKVKAGRIEVGKTYYRHGDPAQAVFTVLDISADYQRNSLYAYRTARVRLADGSETEYKVAANQQYVEVQS